MRRQGGSHARAADWHFLSHCNSTQVEHRWRSAEAVGDESDEVGRDQSRVAERHSVTGVPGKKTHIKASPERDPTITHAGLSRQGRSRARGAEAGGEVGQLAGTADAESGGGGGGDGSDGSGDGGDWCGNDVTVLVCDPLSGIPVALGSHDSQGPGGVESERVRVLAVRGAVIVWAWEHLERRMGARGQDAEAWHAKASEVIASSFEVVVTVDGRRREVISREWRCEEAVGCLAHCAFDLRVALEELQQVWGLEGQGPGGEQGPSFSKHGGGASSAPPEHSGPDSQDPGPGSRARRASSSAACGDSNAACALWSAGRHSLVVSVVEAEAAATVAATAAATVEELARESTRDKGKVRVLGVSGNVSFEIGSVLHAASCDSSSKEECSGGEVKGEMEGLEGEREEAGLWEMHPGNWRGWMMPFYQQVAAQASRANAKEQRAWVREEVGGGGGGRSRRKAGKAEDEDEDEDEDVDEEEDGWEHVSRVPMYILSVPHRMDRREHCERLLGETLGFRNVSLTHSVPRLGDAEVQQLIDSGRMHKCSKRRFANHGAANVGIALANALSHLNTIEQHASLVRQAHEVKTQVAQGAREHGWVEGDRKPELVSQFVGMFEDDLMLTSSVREVRRRIKEALEQLPASADMLYLEASWETCEAMRFNDALPAIVRASRPSGGAAIIFTNKGLLKVSQMLGTQVWNWYDLMFKHSIAAGVLEAYMTVPACFVQDGFFGTSFQRNSEMGNVRMPSGNGQSASQVPVHQPVYPLCVEHYFSSMTHFSQLIFSLAHIHTQPEGLRTLSLSRAAFENRDDMSDALDFFTDTAPSFALGLGGQARDGEDGSLLPEFLQVSESRYLVKLPHVLSTGCIELSMVPESACWHDLSEGGWETCTIFAVNRDIEDGQPLLPMVQTYFVVGSSSQGCGGHSYQ